MDVENSPVDLDQQTIATAIAALLNGDSTPETRAASEAASDRLDQAHEGFELHPCLNSLWATSRTESRQPAWLDAAVVSAIGIALVVVMAETARVLSMTTNSVESSSSERKRTEVLMRRGAT